MAIKPRNTVEDNETQEAAGAAKVAETVVAETTAASATEAAAQVEPEKAVAAEQEGPATVEGVVEDRAAESASVLEEEEEVPEPTVATQAEVPEKSQVIVPKAETGAVATRQNNAISTAKEELAEEGFEGVDVDYSSFLGITLNKQFETSEGHELPNSGFLVRLAQSRKKYCFRNDNPVEDDVEVAYSYDRNADTDPESPVFAAVQKWHEEGLKVDSVKEYLEVWAEMLEDNLEGEQNGELVGRLVSMQISPTSKGRFGGYTVQLGLRKQKPGDVKTLVRRGKKIESGKFPFYPWEFVCKGPLDA